MIAYILVDNLFIEILSFAWDLKKGVELIEHDAVCVGVGLGYSLTLIMTKERAMDATMLWTSMLSGLGKDNICRYLEARLLKALLVKLENPYGGPHIMCLKIRTSFVSTSPFSASDSRSLDFHLDLSHTGGTVHSLARQKGPQSDRLAGSWRPAVRPYFYALS